MTDVPVGLRIWKHSHGTTKTFLSEPEREQLKADSILTIGGGLEQFQVENFRRMQRGDFIYLCHGNDIQLLGQVATDILNPLARRLRRKYTVVRRLEPGSPPFKGHRKAWSPGGNTTCWPVPETDHPAFEKDILWPYLRLRLGDLKHWRRANQKESSPEAAELPPPPSGRHPFKQSSGRRISSQRGESSVRVYDPDKTGRRKFAHDKLLNRFSRLFPRERKYSEKNSYDLLVDAKGKALLVEAKTIRGDAMQQLRLALAQVLYYQHVIVKPSFRGYKVTRLVITDAVPPDYMVKLLEKYDIGVVWMAAKRTAGQSELGRRFLKTFGVILKWRA